METSLDGELLTVQFGRAWLDKILGLVLPLTDEQNYNPNQDQELATLYARDIVVRLMGGEVYLSGQSGSSPMSVSPLSFESQGSETFTRAAGVALSFWPHYIYSDNLESYAPWVKFSLFLTEQHTALKLWTQRNSNHGKFKVVCSDPDVCSDQVWDLYNAVEQLNYTIGLSLDVPSDNWYDFIIYRQGKSAGSSGYYVVLDAVEVIR